MNSLELTVSFMIGFFVAYVGWIWDIRKCKIVLEKMRSALEECEEDSD